jgi:membrane protease YdiL (CAAX protease family)
VLPIIAVFGIVQCLIYERTGSLFAVIAVHAGFNTVAMLSVTPWWALGVGLVTIAGCVLVPCKIGPGPSPFGNDPRTRAAMA